jgi:hypothetical protein
MQRKIASKSKVSTWGWLGRGLASIGGGIGGYFLAFAAISNPAGWAVALLVAGGMLTGAGICMGIETIKNKYDSYGRRSASSIKAGKESKESEGSGPSYGGTPALKTIITEKQEEMMSLVDVVSALSNTTLGIKIEIMDRKGAEGEVKLLIKGVTTTWQWNSLIAYNLNAIFFPEKDKHHRYHGVYLLHPNTDVREGFIVTVRFPPMEIRGAKNQHTKFVRRSWYDEAFDVMQKHWDKGPMPASSSSGSKSTIAKKIDASHLTPKPGGR